jgi:hypothetical protein
MSVVSLPINRLHVTRTSLQHRPHRTLYPSRHITITKIQCNARQSDIISDNASFFRLLPLLAGSLGIAGVVTNRVFSGVAPMVAATSSQSRTDVLLIVMSAVLVLTGLQWLSLRSKPPTVVEPDGTPNISFHYPTLPDEAKSELQWVWESVQKATRTKSMVVFYSNKCIWHTGYANNTLTSTPTLSSTTAQPGPICKLAMSSGSGNYLANLVLFPGRVEFTSYLPKNTQSAIIHPIGKEGVVVLGGDTQRGYTRLDQAWVAAVADKLEVTLENWRPSGSGFASY